MPGAVSAPSARTSTAPATRPTRSLIIAAACSSATISIPRSRTTSAAPAPSRVSSMRSFRNCFTSKVKPPMAAARSRSASVTSAASASGRRRTSSSLRSAPKPWSSARVARPRNCATDWMPGTPRSARSAAAPTRVDSPRPTPGAPVMCMTKLVSWNSGRNSSRSRGTSATPTIRARTLPSRTLRGRSSARPSARS